MASTASNFSATVTEYGDEADISFIGLLDSPEDCTVYCYLRCTKHSKRIQADKLIHRYTSRNQQPTPEQKVEIADLLIAAQEEGHKKNFVYGDSASPGKGGNIVVLDGKNGRVYITLDGPLAGTKSYNFLWLLQNIRSEQDSFKNYENLRAILSTLVTRNPNRLKWIAELQEDFYGTYV